MTLRDYLEMLRRRAVLVVVVVVVVSAVTAALAVRQRPSYEATVLIRVRPVAPIGGISGTLQQGFNEQADLGTESAIARSKRVADAVIQQLGLRTTSVALLNSIGAGPIQNTAIIAITAHSADAEFVKRLANAFGQSYLDTRRAQAREDLQAATAYLTQQLRLAQDQRDKSEARLAGLKLSDPEYTPAKAEFDAASAAVTTHEGQILQLADTEPLRLGFGEILQPADSSRAVRARALTRTITFGALVGFPLALAIVLLLESLGGSVVRTKEQAEEDTGAPVLGLVPYDASWSRSREPRLTTAVEPFSAVAEAYRRTAYNLLNETAATGANVIVITSPGAGEGKTATSTNLGVALSDIGREVVLVEANTRWPRAYQFLHADPTPGLAEVLSGRIPITQAIQWLRPSLGFLASGTADFRFDLALARADLAALLRGLAPAAPAAARRPRTDTPAETPPEILVDTPPLLAAGEVAALVGAADGVVLVLRAGSTTRKGASLAAEQVRRGGGRLLGVVLIGVRSDEELGFSTPDEDYRPRGLVRQNVDSGTPDRA